MSSDYLASLNSVLSLLESDENSTYNASTCTPAISHYRFYQFTLIPAVVIIIIFSFFEKRKEILPNCLGGRPGCIYPMDALTRSSRISYACAYGATVFLLNQVIFEQKFAFQYDGPLYLKTLVVIVSVVVYGLAFYPIFACLTLESMFSYGLGALYVWMFTAIEFYQFFECEAVIQARLILFGRNFPSLACWLYLSISIPARFIQAARKRSFFQIAVGDLEQEQSLKDIRDSYQGHAVRALLTRPDPPPPPPTKLIGKIKAILLRIIHDWLYHRKKDFRYSSRMLSVMIVGLMLIYVVTFELISTLYPIVDAIVQGLFYFVIEPLGYYPEPDEPQEITDLRNFFYVTYYVLNALQACLLVSSLTAFVIGVLSILHMLSSYRRNLQALHRGDHSHIPTLKERSNASHMVGFLRYAGYQVGYIAWAYLIQFGIILLVTFGLATAITFLMEGYTDWLVNRVLQLWPVLLMTLALNVIQLLVSKFYFTQNRGEYMAMDNRRVLFVFSYFMFFFNVFLGVVSCLMRILKSVLIGTLFLGRLDHSTLTRRFQFLDPGFAAYVGFLHVENAHIHPCMVVFVRLMLLNLKKRPDPNSLEKGDNTSWGDFEMKRRRKMGARFNWLVAYSLLNNPSLRMYRKGYIQGIEKALKEGKKRQLTDTLADDIHAFHTYKNGDQVTIPDVETKDEQVSPSMKPKQNGITKITVHM